MENRAGAQSQREKASRQQSALQLPKFNFLATSR
jgi:hypothetical protein